MPFTERQGLVVNLATLEAAPSRPWAFRGGCIRGPCRRPALLLRREGPLRAAAGLILPLKEIALPTISVLWASEEHPAQLQRPSQTLRKGYFQICSLSASHSEDLRR